jgi:hypothetical protein
MWSVRTIVVVAAVLLGGGLLGAPAALAEPGESSRTVRWAGQEFLTPAGLAAWLQSRDLGYTRWAANHPSAAERLEGGALDAGGPASVEPPPSATSPTTPAPLAAETTRSPAAALLIATLLVLAGGLLGAAAAPPRLLAFLHTPELVHERRTELAATGAALALALGAAYAL